MKKREVYPDMLENQTLVLTNQTQIRYNTIERSVHVYERGV